MKTYPTEINKNLANIQSCLIQQLGLFVCFSWIHVLGCDFMLHIYNTSSVGKYQCFMVLQKHEFPHSLRSSVELCEMFIPQILCEMFQQW